MGQIIDLTNQTFGDWTAIRYIGDSMWECMNSEGEVKNIHSYTLRTKLSNHTKLGSKQPEGVLGNTFGQWTPIKYLGAGFWECKCTCGNTGKVNTYDLKNGFSTRCKQCKDKAHMKTVYNPGDRLGEWTIMYYAGDMRWHCKCSCGKEKDVLTKYLRDGTSKSCGHDRNYHIIKDDITGKRFGSLVVPGYTGSSNMWQCKCDCGTIKNIHRDSLMTGKTKSCGCLKETMRAQTLFARYGDTNTNIDNNIKVCIGYKDNDRLTGVVTFEDEQEDSAVISNIAWEHSLDMAKMLADICGKIQSKDIKTTCVLYNGPIITLCTAGF